MAPACERACRRARARAWRGGSSKGGLGQREERVTMRGARVRARDIAPPPASDRAAGESGPAPHVCGSVRRHAGASAGAQRSAGAAARKMSRGCVQWVKAKRCARRARGRGPSSKAAHRTQHMLRVPCCGAAATPLLGQGRPRCPLPVRQGTTACAARALHARPMWLQACTRSTRSTAAACVQRGAGRTRAAAGRAVQERGGKRYGAATAVVGQWDAGCAKRRVRAVSVSGGEARLRP